MLNVYMEKNAQGPLLKKVAAESKPADKKERPDMCLHMMDNPLFCNCTVRDDGVMFDLYPRFMLPWRSTARASGLLAKGTGVNTAIMRDNTPFLKMELGDENPAIRLLAFNYCMLAMAIDQGWLDIPENSGEDIYIHPVNDELVFEKVSGDSRPDLKCIGQDGKSVVDARPYTDDICGDPDEYGAEGLDLPFVFLTDYDEVLRAAVKNGSAAEDYLTVFLDTEMIDTLLQYDYELDELKGFKPFNTILQFIDEPTKVKLKFEGETVLLEVYNRDELDRDFPLVASVTYEVRRKMWKDAKRPEALAPFLAAALACNLELYESGMTDDCLQIAGRNAGIAVSEEGDGLTVNTVSGRERPNLVCSTLDGMIPGFMSGETKICRPYTDETGGKNFILMRDDDDEKEEDPELVEAFREHLRIEHATDPDFLKAKADGGNAEAQAKYGGLLLTDDDNPDYEEGFRYVSMSAENGCEEGMMLLGACFHRGLGTEKSPEKAIEWYEKCIEINPENTDIIHELGHLYLEKDEHWPIDNLRISVEYFRRAGELGDGPAADSARLWGYILSMREKGILPEDTEPVEWVISRAESGDADAQAAFSGSTERWESFDHGKWEEMKNL